MCFRHPHASDSVGEVLLSPAHAPAATTIAKAKPSYSARRPERDRGAEVSVIWLSG